VLLASFLRRKLLDCADLYLEMSRYLGCTRCSLGLELTPALAVWSSCFLALAKELGTCCASRLRLVSLGMDCRVFRLPDPGATLGALLIPRRGISGVLGQAATPAPLCARLSFPAGAEVGLVGACDPATLCLLLSIRISRALFMRVLLSGTEPWLSWFSSASSSSLLE